MFHPEGDSGNIYRTVLYDDDSPHGASCPSPDIHGDSGGQSSSSSSGVRCVFPFRLGPPSVDVGCGVPVWIDDHGINDEVNFDIDVCALIDATDGSKLGISVRGHDGVVLGIVVVVWLTIGIVGNPHGIAWKLETESSVSMM